MIAAGDRRRSRPEPRDRPPAAGALFSPYRRRLGAVLGLICLSAGARDGLAVPAAGRARRGDSAAGHDPAGRARRRDDRDRGRDRRARRRRRRCSPTRSASGSCTTCARPSTATSSDCHWPSSPAPAPVRFSRGSPTTSVASRASSPATATSIVSNVTTVLAAATAMFLLDWRLALAALGLLPFFVWLTRRVGQERRRITSVRQGRLADISALVEESLSVSGILLGKTYGRSPRARRALRARVGRPGRPRGPLADGRSLADGVGADRASRRCRR